MLVRGLVVFTCCLALFNIMKLFPAYAITQCALSRSWQQKMADIGLANPSEQLGTIELPKVILHFAQFWPSHPGCKRGLCLRPNFTLFIASNHISINQSLRALGTATSSPAALKTLRALQTEAADKKTELQKLRINGSRFIHQSQPMQGEKTQKKWHFIDPQNSH